MTLQQRVLKVSDRCDRCGAQAFVHIEFEKGSLMMCAHHFHRHEDKLRELAHAIIDESDHINRAPSISANAD